MFSPLQALSNSLDPFNISTVDSNGNRHQTIGRFDVWGDRSGSQLALHEGQVDPVTGSAIADDGTARDFRPSDKEVWGLPGNDSFAYFRSPCPALNTLANHGHIPRDGKDLTLEILGEGIMTVYNFDKKLLDVIFKALPSEFTLADLNFIDQDASLVHMDSFFQLPPFKVNETLVHSLLSTAEDIGDQHGRVLTKHTVARFRRHREIESARDNPEYSMSALASFVANGEASFVLLGLGDSTTATISVDHAWSFLVDERILTDFRPSTTPITITSVLLAIAELKLRAWLV